jgi:Domain of unknown function (DUF3127)
MDITGRLIQVLQEQTGEGKNGKWAKCDFVIETQEKYPKKVCICAWNDLIHTIRGIQPETEISVSFDISSREYNGKWYTDVKAWKIASTGNTSGGGGGSYAPAMSNEGGSQMVQESSERTITEDDLPF